MLISQILQTKGDMVFTISPGATLAQACTLLRERRVGALVVREGAGPVRGIVSERDVVRAVAAGAEALASPVERCMTGEVVYADPHESVDALLERMTDRRFRHLPVCEGDRLVGIVSIGDLVKAKIDATQAEADGLKAYISAGWRSARRLNSSVYGALRGAGEGDIRRPSLDRAGRCRGREAQAS